jgi:hypothetical protein
VFRKDLQSLIWQFNSQNQYFTLDTLLTDSREKLEFEGGRTTLHKILKSICAIPFTHCYDLAMDFLK